MTTKVRLPTVPKHGECIAVRLGKTDRGAPITALVVRALETGLGPSRIRAYLNECQHIPIPIDSGTGEYLSEDGTRLLCQTHGAFYQLQDGLCIQGPCVGRYLQPVALEQDDEGQWWVGPVVPVDELRKRLKRQRELTRQHQIALELNTFELQQCTFSPHPRAEAAQM